mgnify:CR=1 FL=1
MSTLIRLEHLSAEVRLPDGERLTTVDDVSASFERGTSTAIIEGTWLTGADEPATLETAVNESARQYVHDGTVALARTGNPQQVAGTGERCHRRRDGHTHHLRQRDHTATLLAASLGPESALLLRPSKPYGCNPRWRCDEPEAILNKPADSWMVGIPIIDCIR